MRARHRLGFTTIRRARRLWALRPVAARIAGRCCGLLLLGQLLAGCITYETVSRPGRAPAAGERLAPGDRIALVPGSPGASDFTDCVVRGLPAARFVPPEEVYRLGSPVATAGSDRSPDVLTPEVRARLAASRIRYVMVIDGDTVTFPIEGEAGVVQPSVPMWTVGRDRSSEFKAEVFDTGSGDFVTRARANVAGGAGVAFPLLIIPVPAFAPTEWMACRAMRKALLETVAALEAGAGR